MYQKARLSTSIFVVIVMCVLALASGTYVFAQDNTGDYGGYTSNSVPQLSSSLTAVEGGPGFYAISPVDFTPVMWGSGRAFSSAMLVNPNQTLAYYVAPAHLPDGATISKMVAYYLDNADPYLDLTFTLIGCSLALGNCEILIDEETAHAVPEHRIGEYIPAGPILIDLQSMYYLVQVGIDPAQSLGVTGIRIDYGYPVFLPTINR